MAYSRLNGTILSSKLKSTPSKPAPVKSSEILQAWDNFLGVGGAKGLNQQAMSLLGLGAGKFLFPGMVGWFLNSITALSAEGNPSAETRAVNALQSLLAIPLYWCQTGTIERLAMSSLPSAQFINAGDALNITGIDRNTRVSLAVLRNEIAMSRGTLVAYVVLTSLTLIICIVALSIGSFMERSKAIPETTSFPAMDFYAHCVLTNADGASRSMAPTEAGKTEERFEEKWMINQMKVELAEPGGIRQRRSPAHLG